MTTPTWLVIGASSGFGEAVAKEALSRSHSVVAAARLPESLRHLEALGAKTVALDVNGSDDELAAALAAAGPVTHVVNAAGFLLEGAVEEVSADETAAIFRTNVLGAVGVSKAAIPVLRAAAARRREGGGATPLPQPVLAHFGSLGSWIGGAACAHYCSTKWAVSGLTEALRAELTEFGIAACSIEPGYFRTQILQLTAGKSRRVQAANPLPEVYGEATAVGQYKAALNMFNNAQPGDVAKGAKVIVDTLTQTGVAQGREIPVRLVLGSDAVDVIRKKCEDTLKLLAEWHDISVSTNHDE